ncbi:MAG: hypothetical protein NWF13_08320 [Candidatus Bathyarchaeota archaeon]|nr:hypothetical protein [Candidatus Bathyarchaeota archaeon]
MSMTRIQKLVSYPDTVYRENASKNHGGRTFFLHVPSKVDPK